MESKLHGHEELKEVQLKTPMHEYEANETREQYLLKMVNAGFVIVKPAVNELLIDIDTIEQRAIFDKNIAIFNREFPDAYFKAKVSRNGYPGEHITVTMPFELHPWQRIAFQAALGSDPVRELLSAIRLVCGDSMPTIFVEDPTKGE